jgi:hypothetical protein
MKLNPGLRLLFLLFSAFTASFSLKAQNVDSIPQNDSIQYQRLLQRQLADSVLNKYSDTTKAYRVGKERDPQRAFWLALALPGAGQIYNGKYWKLPLVYGLLGYGAYNIVKFANDYTLYSSRYTSALNTTDQKDPISGESAEIVKLRRDLARRNRDYYVIVSVAFYAIQIVDAVVDAHLSDFNVNDNLSIHIFTRPTDMEWANNSSLYPLTLRWKF